MNILLGVAVAHFAEKQTLSTDLKTKFSNVIRLPSPVATGARNKSLHKAPRQDKALSRHHTSRNSQSRLING